MYEPRRGSAAKLCSSNLNGKLPGEDGWGGGNRCVYRCACSTWISDAVGSWRDAGRAACPYPPIPGSLAPRDALCHMDVTGAWRAAGWEQSRGLDACIHGQSWLQLPVSIRTPGTARPAPCLSFPTRTHILTAGPWVHSLGSNLSASWGPPQPQNREGQIVVWGHLF